VLVAGRLKAQRVVVVEEASSSTHAVPSTIVYETCAIDWMVLVVDRAIVEAVIERTTVSNRDVEVRSLVVQRCTTGNYVLLAEWICVRLTIVARADEVW